MQLKIADAFPKQEYQMPLNMSLMTDATSGEERLKPLTPNIDENNRNNFRFIGSTFSFESLQPL